MINMVEESSIEFRLTKIEETRDYLRDDLMSEKILKNRLML